MAAAGHHQTQAAKLGTTETRRRVALPLHLDGGGGHHGNGTAELGTMATGQRVQLILHQADEGIGRWHDRSAQL